MADDFKLRAVLDYVDQSQSGITKTERGLDSLKKEIESVTQSFSRFDSSAEAAWQALLKSDRAASMSAQQLGELATNLGVASESEVQAKMKMDQLVAAWERGDITSEQLSQELKELDSQTEEVADSTNKLGLVVDAAMVAMMAKGAIEVGKAAYELGQLGAQSLRTGRAFENISGGAEQAEANLEAMRRATRGAISETDMMMQANRMLQMGIAATSDELERHTRLAVQLGSAMGTGPIEAMENWNMMLANQSLPRLDTYGISSGKVRTRINELTSSIEGMTREEAFNIAVLEEGERALARLGDSIEDDALAFERVEATAANLRTEFAERLAPAVADVLEYGLKILTWSDDLQAALADHADQVVGTSESYEDYTAELERAAEAARMQVDEQGHLVDSYGRVHNENYVLAESTWEAERAQRNMLSTLGEVRDNMRDMPPALRGVRDGINDAADAADNAKPLFGGLADTVLDVGKAFTQGMPDAKDFYSMLLETQRAAGMSVEEIASMAQAMGVADDATIQAQLAGYRLVEQWDDQELSSRELIDATSSLTKYTTELEAAERLHEEAARASAEGDEELAAQLTIQAEEAELAAEKAFDNMVAISDMGGAAEDADEQIDGMRGGMILAEDASGRLQRSVHVTAEKIGGAAGQAKKLGDNLRSIPNEIYVDIYVRGHGTSPSGGGVQETQTGSQYFPGGLTLIGELGPELVALPRGARIFPWSAPETQRAIDQRQWHRGGDTYIINNEMVWELIKEQKRQETIDRAEAMM